MDLHFYFNSRAYEASIEILGSYHLICVRTKGYVVGVGLLFRLFLLLGQQTSKGVWLSLLPSGSKERVWRLCRWCFKDLWTSHKPLISSAILCDATINTVLFFKLALCGLSLIRVNLWMKAWELCYWTIWYMLFNNSLATCWPRLAYKN